MTVVVPQVELLTIEQFKHCLPKYSRGSVTPAVVDSVNVIIGSSAEMLETYKENLVTYGSVMADGKFKIGSYLNAIKYVSHKLLGRTNEEAYAFTFPDRYAKYLVDGLTSRQLGGYASAYNSSKLVSSILAQTLVPHYIVNAPAYQDALNCQVNLMHNAKSEKVRCDAANSVMVQLKPPEVTKIQLDVGITEDKSIQELRASTLKLVAQQKVMLESGVLNAKTVAHSKLEILDPDAIIDGEATEINDDEGWLDE